MEKELFYKFLENRCTEEELAEIIDSVKSGALNLSWKKWGVKEWEALKDNQAVEKETLNGLLDKIHHQININQQKRRIPGNNKSRLVLSFLIKAAAILFIPVLSFLFYTLNRSIEEINPTSISKVDFIEIVSPVGSRSEVQLADGTVVFLNHGSKLSYPPKFYGDTREVYLSGEGYFRVAHNPKKPFIVITNKLHIKALGTEFNVFAYPEENKIETTLVDGKVEIGKVMEGELKRIGSLLPGQHVDYDVQTGKLESEMGDIEKYVSWKEGKLIFKDESIVDITHKLSRWYNVDFEFKNKDAMDFTYTATFVDETLFQILDLLKLATPIDYKLNSRKKLPNGTFSKQKIMIELRN